MTQPRHTADHITDDDLDQLYAERDDLRGQLHLIDGMRQAHMDAACAAVQRAERAEAALNAVRAVAARWAESDVEMLRRAAHVLAQEALDTHTTPTETTWRRGGGFDQHDDYRTS